VKIVSLNAWGGALLDPLVEWVGGCGADVACFQEVTRTPGLNGWTTFADDVRTLPQRASLFEDLRAALPDHQASFVVSDAGPIDDQSGRTHCQDFGIATFVHPDIPIVGTEARFVHGAFTEHDRWPSVDRPRVANGVRLVDREADRIVVVVHAHGLRDATAKADNPRRRAQAGRLLDLVARLKEPGDVTVVCGDFNVLPDSETLAMLKAFGLTDLVGSADTRTSHYPKPGRHAGYLLVSDPDQVRRFEVVAEPEVSDHRPLVLEV